MDSNNTPQIHIPGLSAGGARESVITVFVAVPLQGEGIFLGWTEEGNNILDSTMELLNSSNIEDYGLDAPPGKGIWVFEGNLKFVWSRCGHPLDPPDYDSDMIWTGEWRQPSDDEMSRWKGFKPVHVTTIQVDRDPSDIEDGLAEARRLIDPTPRKGTNV